MKAQEKAKTSDESSVGSKWNGREQPVFSKRAEFSEVPVVLPEVLRPPGQPLDSAIRSIAQQRFGHDFSQVRVHTDEQAAESARVVNARAFTVGQDIFFGAGQYSPERMEGQRLLAHELTHTVQQVKADPTVSSRPPTTDREAELEAHRTATSFITGHPLSPVREGRSCLSVQREGLEIRSPVFEETVTQISDVQATLSGRPLTLREESLTREVFGDSIDYTRVRLIQTGLLEYRTVGNTIRVPVNFTARDAEMAEILVHEMTHVWQYQQAGTSYISVSLSSQIVATIQSGSRNAAYDYEIAPDTSFFDLLPEQQALLVENYYSMLRDQNVPRPTGEGSEGRRFRSNHMDANGNFLWLSWDDRQAEISRELPLHRPLIRQMQQAQPQSEIDLLNSRMMDIMTMPGPVEGRPEELQLAPTRPLLQIRFPGLTELVR